jgi:hypothetical protein
MTDLVATFFSGVRSVTAIVEGLALNLGALDVRTIVSPPWKRITFGLIHI